MGNTVNVAIRLVSKVKMDYYVEVLCDLCSLYQPYQQIPGVPKKSTYFQINITCKPTEELQSNNHYLVEYCLT